MTFSPDDIEAAEGPSDKDLKTIVEYVALQRKLEKDVADRTAELAKANEALKNVKERDLPNALVEAGLSGLPLSDGAQVELVEVLRAGIKTDDNPDREKAYLYLRTPREFDGEGEPPHGWEPGIGWGDLVKNTITVYFGKGEEQTCARLVAVLREDFPKQEFEEKEAVHAQTLAKACREYLTAQDELDPADRVPLREDLLGVYRQRFTKITEPKRKKGSF